MALVVLKEREVSEMGQIFMSTVCVLLYTPEIVAGVKLATETV